MSSPEIHRRIADLEALLRQRDELARERAREAEDALLELIEHAELPPAVRRRLDEKAIRIRARREEQDGRE